MSVISRFSPSPTGPFHIGGGRTAFFVYLFVRHYGGKFFLRIEDTDQERSTEVSRLSIIDGLKWLGIEHDGDIVYQSKRLKRYLSVVNQLLATGQAYRCYCSKERLDKLRQMQLANKQKPRYDGHCRDRPCDDNRPFVVRLKTPRTGIVAFQDLVLGNITFHNEELDDLILLRSNGMPTYHLTVVVDDIDMKITHVIRGMDHVNNTPRQLNLLKALGAIAPVYGHVPMIHGEDGKKLSKRHGATDIMAYCRAGYLPQAMLNFLARLGWSHGNDEILSKKEMIAAFDIGKLSKSPAVFNHDKLLWLNQYYLKHTPVFKLCEPFCYQLQQQSLNLLDGPPVSKLLQVQGPRVKTLKELVDKSRYFYQEKIDYDQKAVKKILKSSCRLLFEELIRDFSHLEDWNKINIHRIITSIVDKYQLKFGQLAQPIRVAVTGSYASPSIDDTLFLLGKDRVLERLKNALRFVS